MTKHYLLEVEQQVNKTHGRLGALYVACMIAIKARKMMLIIAPRGTGKSRATLAVAEQYQDCAKYDRISIAGLAYEAEKFNGFTGVLMVDDIAKTQTSYARVATICTLAELTYSHYVISSMQGSHYEILDFHGSALVNIQPVLLRELVLSNEWEASIQDKTMRYYHLFRPTKPNPLPPAVKIDWGYDLKNVHDALPHGKALQALFAVVGVQWGATRLVEHSSDMLKACAALDKRNDVTVADINVLSHIMKPLQYEELVTDKLNFESDRRLDANRLAILTEYMSYGNFTIEQIAEDYKLSLSQCYRIMAKYATDWTQIRKSPTVFAPSDTLRDKLRKVGIQ